MKLRPSVWQEWYFAIVDVVGALTEVTDLDSAKNYWKVATHRLIEEGNELVTNCNQLKLKSPKDGKDIIPMKYITVRILFSKKDISNSVPSFAYRQKEVSIIRDEMGNDYVRVYEKMCDAEANGRPVTYWNDYCYPVRKSIEVDETNWKSFISFQNEIKLESKSLEGVH